MKKRNMEMIMACLLLICFFVLAKKAAVTAEPLLSVSIHQNSYQNPAVYGPQVFYYTDSKEGEGLAKVLQEKLNKGLSVEHPRTEKGNKTYYLLKRSKGLLVIVECGFLTNEQEAELLKEEAYQDKIADLIAQGIKKHFSGCEGRK